MERYKIARAAFRIFCLLSLLSGCGRMRAQLEKIAPSPARDASCKASKDADGLRRTLPPCWYRQAAAIEVVTFKKNLHYGHELSLDPAVLSLQLDRIKSQGFSAIEIFAPADGGEAYNGLDTKNHYRIDPALGTMADFRRAVTFAHKKHLAVTVFINLGYLSAEAPDWLEAVRDTKAGHDTARTRWFLWAERPDAPEPPTQEDMYLSKAERERDKGFWGWQFSPAAGRYFWARWKADGPDKATIPLPQMNWSDPGWRAEAARIVRFWMETGIDGMLIDAPLCYPNQTWIHNREVISGPVASYGNTMVDPEGGRDAAWITEGGYNTLHDYGIAYDPDTNQWPGDVIVAAIASGNPKEIETSLRRYRDVYHSAGAVLYARGLKLFEGEAQKRRLQQAVLAGIGDIVVYTKYEGLPDKEESELLRLKASHPALYPSASRRTLKTSDHDRFYAMLKTSADRFERVVCVYNFQPTPQTVEVNLGVADAPSMTDIATGTSIKLDSFSPVAVDLPGYGFRFFALQAPTTSVAQVRAP